MRTLQITYYPVTLPPLKTETFKNIKTVTAAWKIIFKRNRNNIKKATYNLDVLIGK